MRSTRSAGHPRWIAFLFVLFGAAAAWGQGSVQGDSIYGLRLPPQIAGGERGEIKDYESSSPGLGYSVRYRLPAWAIDIYFYDLKIPSISADPRSKVVADALEAAKREVIGLGQRGGIYTGVVIKQDYSIRDSGGRTRFICTTLAYHHVAWNNDVDSYLCLGSWNGKFVKFRMTTPHNDASAAISRRFIEAWISVLWPRTKQALH